MKIKYLGPSDEVIVAPYGPHRKGDVKEYPDDFAEELLATSIKQKFEAIDAVDDMTVAQIKAELDARGIEYPEKAKKAELFELYENTKDGSESFDQEALDK